MLHHKVNRSRRSKNLFLHKIVGTNINLGTKINVSIRINIKTTHCISTNINIITIILASV